MFENQAMSMKVEGFTVFYTVDWLRRFLVILTGIFAVTNDRGAKQFRVNADLMRATGARPKRDKGRALGLGLELGGSSRGSWLSSITGPVS